MKIKKSALIYDISNLAYAIADTGEHDRHTLHRVRDICEDGNIDRVSRVLGVAYSNLLTLLLPVLRAPAIDIRRDYTAIVHDYEFCFRNEAAFRKNLPDEIKLKIKENAREYMVAMVMADWMALMMPEMAEIWKFRMEQSFKTLKETVAGVMSSVCSASFRRALSPF